jgi:hypothetical protein
VTHVYVHQAPDGTLCGVYASREAFFKALAAFYEDSPESVGGDLQAFDVVDEAPEGERTALLDGDTITRVEVRT